MYLDAKTIQNFRTRLLNDEKSGATAEKYVRCVQKFAVWLDGGQVTKEKALRFKDNLKTRYRPQTVNAYLAALNKLFAYNKSGIELHYLKIQRHIYRDDSRDLRKFEYDRLVSASTKSMRTCLILQTICSTGIRVSELKFITVEAVKQGKAEISLKGKIRTVLLTKAIRKKLLAYAKERQIKSGCIFITRKGNPLDRRQIWYELKQAAKKAGVALSKVFLHNLRHLFAVEFYKINKDIARLSSVLGHSSINTTMIYLKTTCSKQLESLEKMKMVS